jgi:anti-sigma factor RsiW
MMEPLTPAESACDRCSSLIGDVVDGPIEATAQHELDEHLAACPACRAVLADLRDIRRVAGRLPDYTPRPEVWSGIARRLESELASRPRPFWTGARVALAMAATLLVGVASSVWLLRGPAPAIQRGAATASATPPAAVIQSKGDLVQDVDEHLRIADEHYVKAISGLEQVVQSDQAALDPAVAATLQKNLGVIDQAIRESRDAIKTQPNNQVVQTSLFEALRQKVALLEDTVALINVMRKGDQAGTAKILGKQSKS